MIIKNRLEEVRTKLGFSSQQKFAKFLGVRQEQYNKWVNQKPQLELKSAFKVLYKIKQMNPNITFEQLFTITLEDSD